MKFFGIDTKIKTASEVAEERRVAQDDECSRRDKKAAEITSRFEQSMMELESILSTHRAKESVG